jgi:predicted ArsR family transcriptional regulator
MQTHLDDHDREFLEQLHRLGSATIQQICDATGVTATAIRQRLVRLEGKGLIDRQAVREGRGRPHHVYELTTEALRSLGDNYSDLALILWKEIMQIEEPEIRKRVMGRIKDALSRRYGSRLSNRSTLQRFMELKSALSERGFSVEVDHEGALPVLRESNCPYHELASQDSSICELEQSVFEEVLGMKIERTQCCMDGHHSCEFVPVSEAS